jgi:hypothetical protein
MFFARVGLRNMYQLFLRVQHTEKPNADFIASSGGGDKSQ